MHQNFKSSVFFAAILIAMLSSCSNYYKAIQVRTRSSEEKATSIDSLNNANRYMILRNSDQAYCMKDISVSKDMMSLQCILDTLSPYNKLHLTRGRKGHMRYKKGQLTDFSVLNEAHVYIDKGSMAGMGQYQLNLDKVKTIEVIVKDRKRTTGSYLLGGIGITAVVAAVAAVIFAATFSFDLSPGWP